MRTTNLGILSASVVAFLMAVSALSVQGYYIEITVPEEYHTYRPCGPTEVMWNSDIPVEEGEVLEIIYGRVARPWTSLGTSVNDGHHPWPDPPCAGATGGVYVVRVQYLTDPSVYDEIEFSVSQLVPPESLYTVFIDFTGDKTTYNGEQAAIYPPLYTTFYAYVGVYIADEPSTSGLTEISFALHLYGMIPPGTFENLLPGDLAVGSWDEGVTLYASECVGSNGQVTYVASLSLFYVGELGAVVVADHPEYPKRVLDCDEPGNAYQYVVGSHGGVGQYPPPVTPVRHTTWGSIKAMFR